MRRASRARPGAVARINKGGAHRCLGSPTCASASSRVRQRRGHASDARERIAPRIASEIAARHSRSACTGTHERHGTHGHGPSLARCRRASIGAQ